MNFSENIIINVSGPDKSGKGHVIAAISRKLQELGCEVIVQSAETHNAKKLLKTDDEIKERLSGQQILVTELQT